MAVVDDLDNVLNEIFVLDVLALGVLPSFLLPADEPFRHAVNRVLAVRVDAHVAIHRRNVQGSLQRGELSAIVCLFAK